MRIVRNLFYSSFLASAVLFGLSGCEENALIFPEQIEVESPGSSDRGPVKQNHLKIILDDDETVKFEMTGVDTERVTSIFFSHNPAGEKEKTEVSDFQGVYTIDNLPLDLPSNIEVWAVGSNNLESKVAVYSVTPLPFSADVIADLLSVQGGVMSAVINVYNITKTNATLFYRVDDATEYLEHELPSPTTGLQIEVSNLAVGTHTLSYYLTDENGGISEVRELSFESIPFVESFTTAESKASWTVSVSSNQDGDGAGGPGLIDGDPNTFWHTPWSGTIPPWPHEATIDFGETITLTKFIFLNRHNNGGNAPKDIDLQVSSDGQNFVTHQSFFNTDTGNGATVSFDINSPIATRYVRISNRTGYNASWVNYAEISFEGYR